ncbi:hypothetical protein DCAR_0414596 [Daucus carota subsp. sativus]|uniref:Uncharacterized protein n=1 Tax=Daucus carota subsp. sativus TaxID=79200 RepID=A0A175YCQ7_DAUCS|nr:hypothetical protein DCAR_0414596 [Daucus carota subsp. sativus]
MMKIIPGVYSRYKGLKRRKTSRSVKQEDVLKSTKLPARTNNSSYKDLSQSSSNDGTKSQVHNKEKRNTTPLSAPNGHNDPCRNRERVNFEDMDIGSSTPMSTLSSLHETSEIVEGQAAKFVSQNHVTPRTTPLSNITNNLSRNLSNTSADRGKGKSKASTFDPPTLKPFSRNLFDEEFSRDPTTHTVLFDEDLEETRLPASYLSDDSLSDLDTSYGEQPRNVIVKFHPVVV